MKTNNQEGAVTPANKKQEVVEEVEILDPWEDETENLREELKTERDQYLRLAAEYDNYRRRTKKERKEFANAGKHSLLEQLITIADDLILALKNIDEDKDQIVEALKLIERKFQNVFSNNDVKPFESIGKKFDPEIHEAFDVIAATNRHKPGTVYSEVRRGYFLGEKLLRPAVVIVAQ